MIDFNNLTKKGVVKVPEHIKFNKEQLEAIADIKRFLKSDETYYCLSGKGGTGKTTVIAGALKGKLGVIGVTVSHKAKERLSDSIKSCHTFASACGMKVVKNEFGEKEFVEDKFNKKKILRRADYIVIDECSMISKEGINIVERQRASHAKVIYMGDFRQLPPIEEDGLDSKTFAIKNKSSLTVRIRQGEDNPIVELSDLYSTEIENKTYNPDVIYNSLKTKIGKSGRGYHYVDNSNFIDNFIKDFKDDDSTKFICFRRATVSKYNSIIRESLYKGVKEKYVPGELIIANETFYIGDEIALKNSVEYYIDEVRMKDVKGYECFMISLDSGVEIPVLTDNSKILWAKELKRLSKRKMWKQFWPLKEGFADIDYGYAINTHKSQGSTYKNVYMDFNDILSVTKISDKEKCQSSYVAITRASHNLYLLDI